MGSGFVSPTINGGGLQKKPNLSAAGCCRGVATLVTPDTLLAWHRKPGCIPRSTNSLLTIIANGTIRGSATNSFRRRACTRREAFAESSVSAGCSITTIGRRLEYSLAPCIRFVRLTLQAGCIPRQGFARPAPEGKNNGFWPPAKPHPNQFRSKRESECCGRPQPEPRVLEVLGS